MDEILQHKFFHNTVEHWLISLSIVFGTVLFARLIYRLVNFTIKQFTSRTATKLDDVILEQLRPPVIFAIILTGLWFSINRLRFPSKVEHAVERAFVILISIVITWLLVRVINALIKEFLLPYSQRGETNLNEQLIRLIQQVVKVVLWSLGLIVGLNNAGFDVGALIAGLGIGGLALALAAQDTVKNMLGGLILYLDKPFKVGDRIIIDSFDGVVCEIGIRSTRVKTLEGRLVTFPNGQLSEKPIENFSQGPNVRVTNVLGLVQSTTPEKVHEAIAILWQIAAEKKGDLSEDSVVLFEQFSAYALDIKFVYFIKPNADIAKVRTEVNLEILERFSKARIELAFPTRTIVVDGKKEDSSL